ncbi:MAG: hypothetical protein H6665_00660, partial [Ardenticatenaceae bacterium]|nr:hypothetical protein [Ardenticatenaceae bacterium]
TETAVATEPTATTASAAASAATSAATSAASGEADITPATNSIEAGIVRDRDWKQGAADPLITIIEYGDFQ